MRSKTNLTNRCTILPEAQLLSEQIVGSLTLVTEQNENADDQVNSVSLGIAAR